MRGGLITRPYKAFKALGTRRIEIECGRIPHHFHNVPLKKLLNWMVAETLFILSPNVRGAGQHTSR